MGALCGGQSGDRPVIDTRCREIHTPAWFNAVPRASTPEASVRLRCQLGACGVIDGAGEKVDEKVIHISEEQLHMVSV